MRAVVLAGGKGVRLRPLTYAIPKPLIPVGERPILEEIIARLRAHGFDDIILAVGYRAELIETYFQDGASMGVRIRYVRESEPLGTAGALSLVRRRFPTAEPLLVMNGDTLTRLNMRALWEWHVAGGYEMTIAVRSYESQFPYGVVRTDGDRVTEVVEKPVQRHDVSAGVYVLSPPALDVVPDGVPFDMPELAMRLICSGRPVGAYRFHDEWLVVDRLDQLEELNRLAHEGPVS
ncbi:MAG TPA: sugar phosphate nucleotidyltransferase [Dehalococcoidia bacterium]|nr:sugar phosphate nucleotidyltransferase [Dehalococcoidia bacterium]